MVIAQRAVERPALHAVEATAATGRTRTRPTPHRTRPHPFPRRRAAGAAEAAAVDLAVAHGQDGRELARPFHTHLPRCGHLRRSARASKRERPCLTFGTSSSAMRGTTGAAPQR